MMALSFFPIILIVWLASGIYACNLVWWRQMKSTWTKNMPWNIKKVCKRVDKIIEKRKMFSYSRVWLAFIPSFRSLPRHREKSTWTVASLFSGVLRSFFFLYPNHWLDIEHTRIWTCNSPNMVHSEFNNRKLCTRINSLWK